MTGKRSNIMTEIPLYLVPKAVARLVRLKGSAVFRISVVRTHWHHYNVRVRTNTCRKELRPCCTARPAPGTDGGISGSQQGGMKAVKGCTA